MWLASGGVAFSNRQQPKVDRGLGWWFGRKEGDRIEEKGSYHGSLAGGGGCCWATNWS